MNALWARLRSSLPTLEQLQRQPWLRPVAHRLGDTALWRPRGEALARGIAIGLFWAFVLPVAQILVAALHCLWWRGNIPVAAAATLVTKSFTIGGWLWLAYQSGLQIVGEARGTGWLRDVGLPTAIGMGLFALGSALAGYLVAHAVQRGWRAWRAARRAQRREAGGPASLRPPS